MKAACMNAVRDPDVTRIDEHGVIHFDGWVRCGWIGEVESLTEACPRCLNSCRLAPVVEVPAVAGAQ